MNLKKIFDMVPKFLRRRKLARLLLTLFPSSKIQLVEFNHNARLYADISDSFPLTYFLTRSFDKDYFRIARTFLCKGGVFFDVGANFGFCTFGLLSQIPQALTACYLFEANPAIIECLKHSAELYPDASLRIIPGAVTDTPGKSKLHVIPQHLGKSYLSRNEPGGISHVVLDEVIRREGISKIDFMKLDIEGSEPDALKGCAESLKAGIIKILYFEVTQKTLSRSGSSIDSLLSLVRNFDYELFYVREIDFQRVPGIKDQSRQLHAGDQTLRVAPVTFYPDGLETDLLAVHKTFQSK